MTKKCVVASGILIEDHKILMVKHDKLGVFLYPGGHIESNETPVEALVREFEEETGLIIEPIGETHGIGGEVREYPLPLAIVEEYVRYPAEFHIHFDIIYLVRKVGGVLKNGVWIEIDKLDQIPTYPNVRQIIKIAFSKYNLYRLKKF